jgi:hypothetical protein
MEVASMLNRRFLILCLSSIVLCSCTSHTINPQKRDDSVVAKYVTAFNERNEANLRAIVAESAVYVGADPNNARPLVGQNLASWTNPATSGALLGHGTLDGRDVLVVWTKPVLADGSAGDWTRAAYLNVAVEGGKVSKVNGTIILTDLATQRRVTGPTPQAR